MADNVTLLELKNKILNQADMKNSNFIEDFDTVPVVLPAVPVLSELTLMIQCSIQDLYDMIVNCNEDYYAKEVTITTVPQQTDYQLATYAPDFYRFLGLDFVDSASRIYPLKRFLFKEREYLSNFSSGSNQGYNLFYRLMDQHIRILPKPTAAFNLNFTYVPTPLLPIYNTDVWNFVQGWDDFVRLDVVIKCLLKEESDASVFIVERAKAEEGIKNSMLNRDSSETDRVLNVYDYGTGRGVRRGGTSSNTPPDEY